MPTRAGGNAGSFLSATTLVDDLSSLAKNGRRPCTPCPFPDATVQGSAREEVVVVYDKQLRSTGQSVKFLAAREHIDDQLYALGLCL
jgi:hypothetical protein